MYVQTCGCVYVGLKGFRDACILFINKYKCILTCIYSISYFLLNVLPFENKEIIVIIINFIYTYLCNYSHTE